MPPPTHYCCPRCDYVPADQTHRAGPLRHRYCNTCVSPVDPHPINPATAGTTTVHFLGDPTPYLIPTPPPAGLEPVGRITADPTYHPIPQPAPTI
jgi:hypothetical protein